MSALRLAIPSKGRLKEQTEAWLADAGLRLEQLGGSRGYSAKLDGLSGCEVQLMSAGEISAAVIAGDVHLGVTGEDLLREAAPDLDAVVSLLAPLGFGRARVVVAAPRSWIDVETMADIDDVGARREAKGGQPLRVATKYLRLTRAFFGQEGVRHYRVVESAGATEGAPAAGAADLIVDITTTGATLESNGLKILRDGVILDSQAQLAASLKANWSGEALAGLRALLDVVDARSAGRGSRVLTFNPKFDTRSLGASAPAIEMLTAGEGLCRRADALTAARTIAQAGGGPVRTREADFIFRETNERFDSFVNRLSVR